MEIFRTWAATVKPQIIHTDAKFWSAVNFYLTSWFLLSKNDKNKWQKTARLCVKDVLILPIPKLIFLHVYHIILLMIIHIPRNCRQVLRKSSLYIIPNGPGSLYCVLERSKALHIKNSWCSSSLVSCKSWSKPKNLVTYFYWSLSLRESCCSRDGERLESHFQVFLSSRSSTLCKTQSRKWSLQW